MMTTKAISTIQRALLVCLLGSFGSAVPAQTVFLAPDVPTNPDGPQVYLPWQIVVHTSDPAPAYGVELTLPGDPAVDGLHKLDLADSWLFSVETPSDLGGALQVQPADVVLYSGGTPGPFFDASCVTSPIAPGSNVSALTLSADTTTLFLVFDVATETGIGVSVPTGFATYDRTGSGACPLLCGALSARSIAFACPCQPRE